MCVGRSSTGAWVSVRLSGVCLACVGLGPPRAWCVCWCVWDPCSLWESARAPVCLVYEADLCHFCFFSQVLKWLCVLVCLANVDGDVRSFMLCAYPCVPQGMDDGMGLWGHHELYPIMVPLHHYDGLVCMLVCE